MITLKNIPIILFCLFILGHIQAAEQQDLTFELKSGQKMFDIDDIVRFNWDKQVFELTRNAAMDFMTRLESVGVQGDKFILKEGPSVIYEGTLVTPVSSIAVAGPVIRSFSFHDNVKPPLFRISGGYPMEGVEGDIRFSECLKELLHQAGVLGDIDVNNPPPPIEKVTHGWFGEKDGLRILVETFPETFRLGRQLRIHIHLTGPKYLDENHVFDVNATLISKDDKNSFSTRKIFPYQASRWKNIHVLEMNPQDDAKLSRRRIKSGPAKLSIEVSTREILDKHTETYSEAIESLKIDAIDVFIQPGKALLPEMPNKIMVRFQKAIKDAAWERALEYCSDKIKLKAEEYGSAETFCNDFLPINKVTTLSEFEVCSRGSRNGETVSYSCEVKLKDPDYRYPLIWNLSAVKEDSSWAVEFPTKPLDIWMKHEVLKMKTANDGLQIDPEKSRAGFEVRLIPLTEKFTIGSPMLFRIEMKNISNETLGYTHTSFMVNNPMLVKDSNGTAIPYVDTSYQTCAAPEFVEPGETVILANNYDVRSQYHIIKPGKYTFQFKGIWGTNPSNIVEKYVESKPLSGLESLVEDILPVLPEGWQFTRRIMPVNELAEKSSADEAVLIHLLGKHSGKGTDNSILIAVFLQTDAKRKPYVKLKSHLSGMEYLGQSRWGSVYGKSLNAERLWPNWRNQISKTLEIESLKQYHTMPAEGEEENSLKPYTSFKHNDCVDNVLFTPDGSMILSESFKDDLKISETFTGKLLKTITFNGYSTNSMALSDDGVLLAVGTNTGKAELWDIESANLKKAFPVTEWSIYAVALSHDGKRLGSCAANGTIQIWDIENSKLLYRLGKKGERKISMSFSDKSELVAALSRDGRVSIWDVSNGQSVGDLRIQRISEIGTIAFCPDTNNVAIAAPDGIRFWNPQNNKQIQTIKLPDSINPEKTMNGFGPDSERIYMGMTIVSRDCKTAATVVEDGSIVIWDIETRTIQQKLAGSRIPNLAGGGIRVITFSRDKRLLASGNRNGTVEIYRLAKDG